MVKAVRGAVQIDDDRAELITDGISAMIKQLMVRNRLKERNIISILFTVTGDLKSINPAAALRSNGGWADIPLFCAREPEITGGMKRVVRVLVTCRGISKKKKLKPVYIGGAELLRPDLN